jgi:hypothetical protein
MRYVQSKPKATDQSGQGKAVPDVDMKRSLAILVFIVTRVAMPQYLNCSQIDRNKKLRAFVLSGHGYDERYHSARDLLVNVGFDEIRYEPPGIDHPRWHHLYHNITDRSFPLYRDLNSAEKRSFILSQAWVEMVESAYPFPLRFKNRSNDTWLNDYTFFFEDDIALHEEVQDPYCAIVTGMEMNPPSGVLYLGICADGCPEFEVRNGFQYGKGCSGPCLHAVGLRNMIGPPLIAAVRAIMGPFVTDLAFMDYGELLGQSFFLVGSNFSGGLIFQDQKRFKSIKNENDRN